MAGQMNWSQSNTPAAATSSIGTAVIKNADDLPSCFFAAKRLHNTAMPKARRA